EQAKQTVVYLLEKESLRIEQFSGPDFDDVQAKRIAKAGLLMASLDNTRNDAFVHYVCGSIIAKPKAPPQAGLSRRIILLVGPKINQKTAVAQSLANCKPLVTIVPIADSHMFETHVRDFCALYKS